MKAYQKSVTLESPGRILLDDLPFDTGQQVEVLVLPRRDREQIAGDMKELFKEIQARPEIQSLTDEDIAEEIEAHRSGR